MAMSAAFLVSALVQFALGLVVAWLLGPAMFGIYALSLAAGMLIQTLVFDWVRLGVTRYAGEGDPTLRPRMDRLIAIVACLCMIGAAIGFLAGGVHRIVFALIPLVAAATGVAEYIAAFQRARFDQGAYARLALSRALFAIILTPLAAWWFRSAEAAILAYAMAILAATLITRSPRDANGAILAANDNSTTGSTIGLATIARYSWPVVITNLAYLALFFALRAHVAVQDGLAAAGQFSLALELGLKLVTTLGSALDLYLLQVAIRDRGRRGMAVARQRLGMNAEIVIFVSLVAVVGLWLVLPSLQIMLIAPDFRAGFTGYLGWIAPALVAYAVIQYALHPFMQVAERTTPLAVAALVGLVGGLAILAFATGLDPARRTGFAMGAAMAAAALLLLVRTGVSIGQILRRSVPVIACVVAMSAVGIPLRGLEPGLLTLVLSVIAAGSTCLALAYATNAARLRDIVRARGLPPL